MKEPCEAVVRQATIADLDILIPLFDAYRQFYGEPSDEELARRFLFERLQHNESIILIAFSNKGWPLGFTQLYRSFSSVSAAPILILNDLFVSPGARRKGVAGSLLRAAADFGQMAGAVRLTLSTEVKNSVAQALYELHGWVKQTDFYVYNLPLNL